MDNDIIKHFEREFEYAKASGQSQELLNKAVTFLQFLHNGFSTFPEASIQNLSYLAECYQRFIVSKVLFPLTLNEGEFIFREPGLSVNRRNESVKWNKDGIYYDNAYKGTVNFAYDSFTGNRVILTDKHTEYKSSNNRIYIKTGKYITNIYFSICYLYPSTINSHKYTPANSVSLPLYAMVYKDEFILFINNNDKKFASLKNLYDVRLYKDEDEYLKYFGITNKIEIDVILKKERFTF